MARRQKDERCGTGAESAGAVGRLASGVQEAGDQAMARWRRAPGWVHRPVRLGIDLARAVRDDRVSGLAAEVAFFGMLSVFPGLVLLAAGLGSLETLLGSGVAEEAERLVVGFLDQVLTSRASGVVTEARALFAQPRGGVVTVASLLALLGLSRGFAAAIRALNLAYDVHEWRPYWQQRMVALGLALGSAAMALLTLAMVVVGPLLGLGRGVADLTGLGEPFRLAWTWTRWPFLFALLIVWAAALFHLAPNQRNRWLADLPGAVLAAVLWLVVSLGLSAYLRLAAAGNAVLGVLGGGLILLVWLYLLAFALLLGGELNALLHRRSAGDRQRTEPRKPSPHPAARDHRTSP